METIHQTMIESHIWPIVALALLIALNIVVILAQKDDLKLKKYLRIQATIWTTLMTMIIFTGVTIMAFNRLSFTVSIIVMIAASVAMSSLELRRHFVLKQSKAYSKCFMDVRKKILYYYTLQEIWMFMVGGFTYYGSY